MATKLIITVDTEEEGLWSNTFKASNNTAKNVAAIPDFQAICNNNNAKPVYLVNTPVLEDPTAVSLLKKVSDTYYAEIGCHIHPWNTPPIDKNATSLTSYLCNLNNATQSEKLDRVTKDIESKFGQRPVSFRAGRYGLNSYGAKLLADLGYKVDSSVCPFTNYSADGGPDFRLYPYKPYYIADSLMEPSNTPTQLLEVPVSFGFNWRNFDLAFKLDEKLSSSPLSSLRLRGILSRLGILKKYKFSPEKHSHKELQKLARLYSQKEIPALVMMFHSSSLLPGNSPYVPDQQSLTRFLYSIDRTIDYCRTTLKMEVVTLGEFADNFAN